MAFDDKIDEGEERSLSPLEEALTILRLRGFDVSESDCGDGLYAYSATKGAALSSPHVENSNDE